MWRAYRTRRKGLDDAELDDASRNGATLGGGALDHGALDHGALDHGAPDHEAADHGAPDDGALDGAPDGPPPREGPPWDALVREPVPDAPDGDAGTASGTDAAGDSASSESAPGDSTPGDSASSDSASSESAPGDSTPGAVPARKSRLRTAAGIGLNVVDGILAIGAGVMVIFVHDLKFWLSVPYWLDEAWVADSLRAPLSAVPRLAATTPLGWILLLRLVQHGGVERHRLVPLIFAALAVSAAYLLGRELGLTRFTAGLLTATAALLSPAMLLRNDLKQYTAEAFASIVVWLLVARVETKWSRWRLATLALVASAGTLIAETVILTGAAGLACLGLAALIRRQWRRLAEVAAAAAGTLLVYGIVYEIVIKPRINRTLNGVWAPDYSPPTVTGAASFFWAKLQVLEPYIGFPVLHDPVTGLAITLSIAGVGMVALALMGRFALAALLPVTLVVVMAASAHQSYPFGDLRTSTFWLVMLPVMMAIAVAAVTHGIGIGLRLIHRWVAWVLLPVIAIAGAAAAINYYTRAVLPDANEQVLAHDDPRSQVQYVQDHWRAGDVVIVDYGASYGFAYYYKEPATSYPTAPGNAAGWIPGYPDAPHIIIMTGREAPDVGRAVVRARAFLAAEPPGERGRLWVIRNHTPPDERLAWRNTLVQLSHGGGQVSIINISMLGYLPGYQPVAVYTPPAQR